MQLSKNLSLCSYFWPFCTEEDLKDEDAEHSSRLYLL